MKLISSNSNVGHFIVLYRNKDGEMQVSGLFYADLKDAVRHAQYTAGEAAGRRVWVTEAHAEFKATISVQEVLPG